MFALRNLNILKIFEWHPVTIKDELQLEEYSK